MADLRRLKGEIDYGSVNDDGEFLVESNIDPYQYVNLIYYLENIERQLKIMNLHLMKMSGETFDEGDL